jgi:hypothetical protein
MRFVRAVFPTPLSPTTVEKDDFVLATYRYYLQQCAINLLQRVIIYSRLTTKTEFEKSEASPRYCAIPGGNPPRMKEFAVFLFFRIVSLQQVSTNEISMTTL